MKPTIDDRRIEIIIGRLLQAGVLLAAAVVLVGGIAFLLHHGRDPVGYRVFGSEPAGLRSIAGIAGGAARGDSRSIIQVGLLLLIATPVARVAFSAVAFALERDRLYVAFTLVVLSALLYSLFGAGIY